MTYTMHVLGGLAVNNLVNEAFASWQLLADFDGGGFGINKRATLFNNSLPNPGLKGDRFGA